MSFITMKSFLQKREWIIPLGLFILFLALTLPGISWGAPSVWHPDEIVVRSMNALFDNYQFSETNFDYPDLPQYAMYFLGKVLIRLGYADQVLVASRVLSAVLAGLTVILTYVISRRIGENLFSSTLSGLLLISVSEMPHNGRFAHNDTYLIFFTTLSVLCLLNYIKDHNKLWLYGSFLTIGMAASSKYIGGSLIIAPLIVYLIEQRKSFKAKWLSITETLFISTVITYLGFGFGTPKAVFWTTFYFKRLMPTLQWQVNYGHQPGSLRGIFGQYGVMANGLGLGLVLLFGAGLIWAIRKVVIAYRKGTLSEHPLARNFSVILLALFALDLPMMISYNYQLRYFLTLMPFLAVLTAFCIEHIYNTSKELNKRVYSSAIVITVSVILLYSLARIISLMLLVINDARIPASAFMDTLPPGRSLEHTYYPPTYDGTNFEREHNYPIYFVRGDEPLPTSKKFVYNAGEEGLNDRETEYFVVDSFTTDKFKNQFYCDAMQAECEFFRNLELDQAEHYKLIADFTYKLPSWLPQIKFEFINPSIRIYQRVP